MVSSLALLLEVSIIIIKIYLGSENAIVERVANAQEI
jgi:hypothetical protein